MSEVPHEDNVWLQSIVRYWALNLAVQRSRIKRFIYLDWDTSVYVASGAAWDVLGQAKIEIGSCIYPPFGTANNIFVPATRAGIQDFAVFLAAAVLTELKPGCPDPGGTDMDLLMAYFTYYHTWAAPAAREDTLARQSLNRSWLAFDGNVSLPYDPDDNHRSLEAAHWLHFSPRHDGRKLVTPACSDDDPLCKLAKPRWSRVGDTFYGRFYPPWKFHRPKFEMFNLCEPFGAGNVVSELPFDWDRETGTKSTRVSETPPIWEDPGRRYNSSIHAHTKRIVWNQSCDPYTSQIRREVGDASFGWENYAPEMQDPSNPDRHWYRIWAIHFGTEYKYDALHLLNNECERLKTSHSMGRDDVGTIDEYGRTVFELDMPDFMNRVMQNYGWWKNPNATGPPTTATKV